MKKLFVILPCLLLCLIMVAVPVSAVEVAYSIDVSAGSGFLPTDVLDDGYYSLAFILDASGETIFILPEVYISTTGGKVIYEVPDYLFNGEDVYLHVSPEGDIYLDFCLSSGVMIEDFYGELTFTPVSPKPDPAGVFDVFAALGVWVIGALGWLTGIFWTGSSLTFLGVLAVCALAFAVVFLIIAIIQRFLHFRG